MVVLSLRSTDNQDSTDFGENILTASAVFKGSPLGTSVETSIDAINPSHTLYIFVTDVKEYFEKICQQGLFHVFMFDKIKGSIFVFSPS